MIWVVQQNSSKESLQSAFREVLDPQIFASLQEQIRTLHYEIELNHGFQEQRHNVVHSKMHDQSHQIEMILNILKQHISHSTCVAYEPDLETRKRLRFISASPVKASSQTAPVDEKPREGCRDLDDVKAIGEKLHEL
jgi:hypothetical protein